MVSCAVQKLLKCKFEKLPKHLWGASGKEPACQSRRCWWFHPYDGKIPWRRKWQSTPVSLPGESRGQRSLVGYSPWGRTESNITERLSTAQPVGSYVPRPGIEPKTPPLDSQLSSSVVLEQHGWLQESYMVHCCCLALVDILNIS